MRDEVERYRCQVVCPNCPVPCDVLEDQPVGRLPGHLCAVTARRLTRRFAVRLAPVPDAVIGAAV
jgi:hypothetical protein